MTLILKNTKSLKKSKKVIKYRHNKSNKKSNKKNNKKSNKKNNKKSNKNKKMKGGFKFGICPGDTSIRTEQPISYNINELKKCLLTGSQGSNWQGYQNFFTTFGI